MPKDTLAFVQRPAVAPRPWSARTPVALLHQDRTPGLVHELGEERHVVVSVTHSTNKFQNQS